MSDSAPSDHASSEHGHEPAESGPAALDPDEPSTPYWLTALGGALFLLVAVFFLATAGDEPEAVGSENGGPEAPAADQNPADEPSEE